MLEKARQLQPTAPLEAALARIGLHPASRA